METECQRFRLLAFSFNGRRKQTNVKNQRLYLPQPLWPGQGANNHFCYAYNDPALPRSSVEYPAYKRPDTWAHQARHRCKGTSVRDKTDRHSYVCANLNFQMGVYLLSQPRALLPEIGNLLRYNDVASSITHSRWDYFSIFHPARAFF
jgi:hypothetical protein